MKAAPRRRSSVGGRVGIGRIIKGAVPAAASERDRAGFAGVLPRATLRAMFVRRGEAIVEEPEPGVTRQVLGNDSELMMVRVTFVKGAVGYLHHHPHRQVSYVEHGAFEVRVGEDMTVLREGDCYFVSPDVAHGVKALEDASLIDVFVPARMDFLAR
jgi:quercetin dioxygenase-like cupin family protein